MMRFLSNTFFISPCSASAAVAAGNFNAEIVPVSIAGKAKGAVTLVSLDEEPAKLKADKVPTLKPAFLKDGNQLDRIR